MPSLESILYETVHERACAMLIENRMHHLACSMHYHKTSWQRMCSVFNHLQQPRWHFITLWLGIAYRCTAHVMGLSWPVGCPFCPFSSIAACSPFGA